MSAKPVKTRVYDNSNRAAQALATRRRVIAAAHELLLERGYASTTLKAVAGRAEVSVDTVYKGFGNKATLTKHVYDVVLAGDDAPIPMAERPEMRAIGREDDPRRMIALYASVARQIAERLGPLLSVLLGSRGVDADLDRLVDAIDGERLIGSALFVGHLADTGGLRAELDIDRARDMLWAINSPEVYLLLVSKRGWPIDEFESWLADTLADALLQTDRR